MTKITKEQLYQWIGNHGYGDKQIAEMLDILVEVANGEYEPKQLQEDIRSYDND